MRKQVRVYTTQKILTLDPIYSGDIYRSLQVANVYEGLLQYHYLDRPYRLVPNLAEGMPEFQNDGRVILFKIKKGIFFQDDPCFQSRRELTAEDFVYSWKRLADPRNEGSAFWMLRDKIVGLDEWRERAGKSRTTDYSEKISGLLAIGKYELRIELKKRSSNFLYHLASSATFVVPREAVEYYGDSFSSNPVGTGPFRLDREKSDLSNQLFWVGSRSYRDEYFPGTKKKLPRSRRVEVRILVEEQPIWLLFKKGELDYTHIPKDYYDSVIDGSTGELKADLKKEGIRLEKAPRLEVNGIVLNLRDPWLKNPKLRQAMSLAIDREAYVRLFDNGRSEPAQGPIPPGVLGYDSGLKNEFSKYDPQKAKKLLKESGILDQKTPPQLELSVDSGSRARQDGEFFRREWEKIGLKVEVRQYPFSELVQRMKESKGQMFRYGWVSDYPEGEDNLQLFYGPYVSPGPNGSNYRNSDFDRLFEKAALTTSRPEREKLYRQMVSTLIPDCPWIWVSHRKQYVLVRDLETYRIHALEASVYKYWE